MGRINSVFTGSAVDGPGIRSVVFFQGCPLRCVYCHNPETHQLSGGEEIEPDMLFNKISRYANYYGKKGGVTFSGGEVLMQPEFLTAMLKLCKNAGIHTCIDTSGCTGAATPDQIFELCDLVILDIKMNSEEDYEKYINGSLGKTLEFLQKCEENQVPVWIRQVIVPGINDSEEQIGKLKKLVSGIKCIEKIQLLPFERLCEKKYTDMGIPFPMGDTPAMDRDRLAQLQKLAEN
ncbi:MAG: pyruvate formate lyase-activating protein [Clostridia bacterium]|nr:pyruvate formate lyase-activating protein [Clostridia bacterium]